MIKNQKIERLREKIKSNQLDEAIASLMEVIKQDSSNYFFLDKIIEIQNRIENTNRQIRLNLITDKTSLIEQSKIALELLKLTDELISKSQQKIISTEVDQLQEKISRLFDQLELFELIKVLEDSHDERIISKGSDFFDEDKILKIRREIKKCQEELLKNDSKNQNLYKKLLSKKKNNHDLNKEDAQKLITLDIENYEVTRDLALIYQNERKYNDALRLFNRILDNDHANLQALIDKAELFKLQQDYNAAIDILTAAQSLAPKNNTDLLFKLAQIRQENNQLSDAEKIYHEILEINKQNIEAIFALAKLFFKRSEPDKAINYFQRALKINPNSLEALSQLGFLYFGQSDFLISKEYFEKYLKINKSDKRVLLTLARICQKLEEYPTSYNNYQIYLKTYPKDKVAISELGKLYHVQKNHSGGIDFFHNLLNVNFNSKEDFQEYIFIRIELARLYLQKPEPEPEKAILLLRDVDFYNSKYPEIYNNPEYFKYDKFLAKAYLASREKSIEKYENAHDCIDRALKKNPEDAECWQIKGKIYIEQPAPDYDSALDVFKKAEELENIVEFQYNLKNPAKLTSISLTGLNFFSDSIWYCENINILLGRNGYGKSHLLRLLLSLLQKDHKISLNYFSNSREKANACIRLSRVKKDSTYEEIIRESTKYEGIGKLPILAIPDVRYLDKSRNAISSFEEDGKALAENGAYHFLYEKPYEGLIENFFYKICITYLERRPEFDSDSELFNTLPIFKLLQEIFEELTGSQLLFNSITRIGETRFKIDVLTEGNPQIPLPIQKTSQGTLSILAIFGLIYSFLQSIYLEVVEEKIEKQFGIVFIDEIDAHLHPAWQRKVIPLIQKKFPNVQFFITAHSPLIVAGCKEKEVAVLRKDETKFRIEQIPNDFIGWETENIFDAVFEIEDGKDQTYLDYGLHVPRENDIRDKIDELEKKEYLSEQEEIKLDELIKEEKYIRRYKFMSEKKKLNEDLEETNQELILKILSLEERITKIEKNSGNG